MNINNILTTCFIASLKEEFEIEINPNEVNLQQTKPEFEGTHTFVCFHLSKSTKTHPKKIAESIGSNMIKNCEIISNYNVINGFLNVMIDDKTWLKAFKSIYKKNNFGSQPKNKNTVMVEFSSPNTNKPLHLGHLRNIFLGWSVANILEYVGNEVIRVQIVNDRGIHICKSMIAWILYGNNSTPHTTKIKGDKFVGNYYVKFDQVYKQQQQELIEKGRKKEEAEKEAPILKKAQELLLQWEKKDKDCYDLWKTMNQWVYEGFDKTYKKIGVKFDKNYYESDTYLYGKEEVLEGVTNGIFEKKEDHSIWVNLSDYGLDNKLLLRSDGTSVYMTQDIGTAIKRYNDYPNLNRQIYTVGNEQEYHFKVLFSILSKLGYHWADNCHHLSYGMVDLPNGKMKSREGNVVDADDLLDEMVITAKKHSKELGKLEGFSEKKAVKLYNTLGKGALKYFLLRIAPKKKMLFNPKESIQFHGNTAPFIQYTHARICAIIKKAKILNYNKKKLTFDNVGLLEKNEINIINLLQQFPNIVMDAANKYSPDIVAQYIYDLAKEYNKFYQEILIFDKNNIEKIYFRIALSKIVAKIIKKGMKLLGIGVPKQM